MMEIGESGVCSSFGVLRCSEGFVMMVLEI